MNQTLFEHSESTHSVSEPTSYFRLCHFLLSIPLTGVPASHEFLEFYCQTLSTKAVSSLISYLLKALKVLHCPINEGQLLKI